MTKPDLPAIRARAEAIKNSGVYAAFSMTEDQTKDVCFIIKRLPDLLAYVEELEKENQELKESLASRVMRGIDLHIKEHKLEKENRELREALKTQKQELIEIAYKLVKGWENCYLSEAAGIWIKEDMEKHKDPGK